MNEPNILFFDLETAPNKAYVWSLWNELRSMDYIASQWYVLCWSAKWLGDKEILSAGIESGSDDDRKIMQKLWKLLDEADIVVAHNGKKFDCRRVNARFIANGMTPSSPYRVVDTLQMAKKHFFFTSNRLNDLGIFLKLGKKVKTGGFELWKKCMEGDRKAWAKMMRYCNQDVKLLEKIYLKLLPFMSGHPNLAVYKDRVVCGKCGNSRVHYRGFAYTNSCKYRRFRCTKCGGWGRDKKNKLDNKVGVSI